MKTVFRASADGVRWLGIRSNGRCSILSVTGTIYIIKVYLTKTIEEKSCVLGYDSKNTDTVDCPDSVA